jgi:hypothetical protein
MFKGFFFILSFYHCFSILALETLKRVNQINISKLDYKIYPRMLQTNVGDHPSISYVEERRLKVLIFLA